MHFYEILRICLSLMLLSLLIRITYTDIQFMQIPDTLNIQFLSFAFINAFLFHEIPLTARILGFFCVSAPLLLLTLFVPGSFGGGDIKLMAAAGFLLGWRQVLAAFTCGLYAAAIYILLTYLQTHHGIFYSKKYSKHEIKKSARIAMGPFLSLGIAAAFFFPL